MKIKMSFLVMLFFLNSSYANDIIKLPKEFKIEKTFSGDLSEKESFHLIFTKNTKTKKFEVFSYLYDGNKIEKFESFVSDKSYGIVSFHYYENIISLVLNYKVKKDYFIKRINLNTLTKQISATDAFPHDDFLTSIRNKENSVLVYKGKKEFLIRNFIGNRIINSSRLDIEEKEHIVKEFFKEYNVSSVNTNEFVSNGSTSTVKAYQTKTEDKLVFTKEDEAKNKTETLEVFFTDGGVTASLKEFINTGDKKFKKHTSFIVDNRLYQLGISKELGSIKIWDIIEKKELNVISINDALIAKATIGENFKGSVSFLKQASKNKHIPTITVNKTKGNLVKVRIDYVDVLYSYQYNWWWHQQMWHMQQQMHMQRVMNSVPNFGPSIFNDIVFDNYITSKEKLFFELSISNEGLVLKEATEETIYKEIDKKEYIETLESIMRLKYESSCFLKESFRYIAFSKELDGFIFQTNKLK